MKESFLLYTKYAENIEMLTMEQRGILFTAIMNYAAEKEPPEMDGMVKMAFSFIHAQLDANITGKPTSGGDNKGGGKWKDISRSREKF